MYILFLLILLGLSVVMIVRGLIRRQTGLTIAGVCLGVLTILFYWLMSFWAEMLWFNSAGYEKRFWTVFLTKTFLGIGTAIVAYFVVFLLTYSVPPSLKAIKSVAAGLAALIGLIWGLSNWDVLLPYWHRISVGQSEPVLHHDAGFYLFSLPFLEALYYLAFWLLFITLAASLFGHYLRYQENRLIFAPADELTDLPVRSGAIFTSSGLLLLVMVYDKILSRFRLLYSPWGVVSGPGWTDVHIRLPAYAVVIVITFIFALLVWAPSLTIRLFPLFRNKSLPVRIHPLPFIGKIAGFTLGAWLLILTIIPLLIQWLRVEPNEISLELPYIKNNIQWTRQGFRLNVVEEREFPAEMDFNRKMVAENQELFSNIRLWDYRALIDVYQQFQEFRLYYQFNDVDIDRYHLGDEYRQVMISAREMDLNNLPRQSQTFVNRRFKYTHGFGLTLSTVSEFTDQGLPDLLVKNIPPVSAFPEVSISQPRIYYGELASTYVIANSEQQEFDYPSGQDNKYNHYQGTGGVPIRNFWRKLSFGWKLGGTQLLLSSYPDPTSRILFYRQIRERVQKLAPFLKLDEDPYVVISEGKIYWILDAYMTSRYYPYSEPFTSNEKIEYQEKNANREFNHPVLTAFRNDNYIRNSVKVIIDAYNGSVNLFIFDQADPLIRVWSRVFPDLFKPRSLMSESLQAHIRYPADMLLVQGLVYCKYHMDDPVVFYNQEDLWIRATEKYYSQVQPVEPYYVMWEEPGSDEANFILMQPFTPKNRQVLIGWIAGMCDGDNYGRFLAYQFPKDKRVLGTQQFETKIDQDPYLSGQLTLWDQRGSTVIRGNVLAIPIEKTLLFVEPIYLQAETAAYPEVRLIAVMVDDQLSYAQTFGEALQGLYGLSGPVHAVEKMPQQSLQTLAAQADRLFNQYLDAMGKHDFSRASDALTELTNVIGQMKKQSP